MRARSELSQGHSATAREGFFTASILYGGTQWAIEANTPLDLALNEKKNECYGEFVNLAGRRIERVEVPFGGRTVPAYMHLPPGHGEGKLPCVVILSGMDGWREISVAMDGDKWLARGFAVLAIDGPGQGEALCREVWFDPDTYGQLGPAAYDLAASRPAIDPARNVVHGLSFGSYWATLMAAAEPRFAACGVAMTCFEPHGQTCGLNMPVTPILRPVAVVAIVRNGWSSSIGMTGRHQSEQVVAITRCAQPRRQLHERHPQIAQYYGRTR